MFPDTDAPIDLCTRLLQASSLNGEEPPPAPPPAAQARTEPASPPREPAFAAVAPAPPAAVPPPRAAGSSAPPPAFPPPARAEPASSPRESGMSPYAILMAPLRALAAMFSFSPGAHAQPSPAAFAVAVPRRSPDGEGMDGNYLVRPPAYPREACAPAQPAGGAQPAGAALLAAPPAEAGRNPYLVAFSTPQTTALGLRSLTRFKGRPPRAPGARDAARHGDDAFPGGSLHRQTAASSNPYTCRSPLDFASSASAPQRDCIR